VSTLWTDTNYLDSSWSLGNVTLIDSYKNSVGTYFLAKFDPNGNILWAKNVSHYAWVANSEGDMAVDNAGHIYVSGVYVSPTTTIGATTLVNNAANEPNIFLAQYDASGNAVWAKSFGGTEDDGVVTYLSVTPNGSVYFSGFYQSPSITLAPLYFQTTLSILTMGAFSFLSSTAQAM
jgi:hypothetical protein